MSPDEARFLQQSDEIIDDGTPQTIEYGNKIPMDFHFIGLNDK